MKEIGIEKLIELLNKAQNDAHLFGHYIGSFEWKYYAKNHWRLIVDNLGYTDEQYETFDYSDRDICGKDGGFIQRLVENDKIDFDNRDLKDRFMNEFERYPQFQNNTNNREFNVNGLLMLLSISETPIKDLISYLK